MMRKWFRRSAILWLQLTFTLLLLEGTLCLAQPHFRNLNVLLYISSLHTGFDQYDSLEALLKTSVMGFTPYQKWAGFVLNSRSFLSIGNGRYVIYDKQVLVTGMNALDHGSYVE